MRTTDLSHSNGKSFICYLFTHSIPKSQATCHNTSQEGEGVGYKIITSRRSTWCRITALYEIRSSLPLKGKECDIAITLVCFILYKRRATIQCYYQSLLTISSYCTDKISLSFLLD